MPNCKICGDPVHVATVYHDECLLEAFDKMEREMCEKFCRIYILEPDCPYAQTTCPLTVFEREVFGK